MSIKSISLNLAQRGILIVIALVCVLAVFFVVRWCLGDTIAVNALNRELTQVAIDWAPSDPRAHYAMAVLDERTFLPQDLANSLEEYEKATSLSPNDYRLWFELGTARDHNGDPAGAEKAYRKSLEFAPNYSRVHWALGNLLLRQGNTEEAFIELRKAVENDPTYANPAVATVWQFFNGDVSLISQKIGDSMPIKAALSSFLANQKRFDEAFTLWNALSPEDKKVTYKDNSRTLLDNLLAAKRYRDALSVQTQIDQTEEEKFEVGKIFNPGFESDVKTTSPSVFEWSIADGLQPQIGYDPGQKHGGARSLAVLFNSNTGQEFRAVQQTVAVESGKHYNFEVFSRSDVKSQATVKWEIVDAADGKLLGATNAVPNNSDWAPLTAEFTTGPATQAVIVRFAKVPCPPATSVCPISGKVWFDDFSLK